MIMGTLGLVRLTAMVKSLRCLRRYSWRGALVNGNPGAVRRKFFNTNSPACQLECSIIELNRTQSNEFGNRTKSNSNFL